MAEEEESWEEFFDTNRLVPIHPSRCVSQQPQPHICFCINLKSIEGILLPKILDNKPADTIEFQLRITFYDAANKYFYGSTWLGPVLPPSSVDNRVFKVDCDECLYFHSSLNDYTCLAAIEVIAFEKNQGYNCGWSILRMFNQPQQLRDSSSTTVFSRLRFYYGSVQTLFYIPEEIEKCSLLRPIEGFFINYSLNKHSALEKVMHLIPENALLSGDDIVPGILDTHHDDSGFIDILKKPRLAKSTTCFLNKLSIVLDPSVEEFEEQLLIDLNQDRLVKNDIIPDDGLNVKIVERRLKVSVHNGWTFVSEPHIVFLEEECQGGRTGRKSPSSMSSVRGKVLSLAPRSRLELKEMVQHPWFAMVFQVDYVISEPFTQPLIETKKKKPSLSGSLMRSQNHTITVRWGVWTPFDGVQAPNEAETLVELHGEADPFPEHTLVYADTKVTGQTKKRGGTIKFSFTQQRKRTSSRGSTIGSSEHLSKPTVPSLQVPSSVAGTLASHSTLGDAIVEVTDHVAPLTPGVVNRPPLPGRGPRDHPGTGRPAVPIPVGDLNEVTFSSQVHSPVVLMGTGNRISTIPRAAYARLATAGFPSITDRHGNPPLVLDPAEVVRFDLELEEGDPQQCNEIVVQFLAMTGCLHRSVYFTFQFYRFPQVTTERMYLKSSDAGTEGAVVPQVLLKFTRDGSLSGDPPGLMMRFVVDPAFMQQGENRIFSRYLLAQSLHIDVWDGDSLLLIGSFSVELKHVLRQGREAVLVNHELDVLSSELSEDTVAITGDITKTGIIGPLGIKSSVVARLHVRVANVGHHSETPKTKIGTVPQKPTKVVMSSTVTGGTMNSTAGLHKPAKCKAKQLAERDGELAAVLFTRREQNPKEEKKTVKQVDSIRKRKLDRMQAIRQTQGSQNSTGGLIIQKEEKVQRARDLKTIQLYRERAKHEGILASLQEHISSTHTIYPSFGTAEYFEFVIRNPYSTEQTISVRCDDKELRVITDTREWRHLKKLAGTPSAIEENMFHESEDSPYPQIFLRPREAVHIPFRFQTFRTDNLVPAQGPAHPLNQTKATQSFEVNDESKAQSRSIKVSFNLKDERPVAILNVLVEPGPHTIDYTQRFYHPEQSFLKKTIRLPPWHTLPGAPIVDDGPPQLFVRCSDPNVICESRKSETGGEPTEVFLKVACGPSPTIKRFFLLLFIDAHMAVPCQIWQFFIHSLQRVDISAIEGQSSRLSVILRGTQSSRLVKCYSSHPDELMVSPSDPFMLMANAVHEVHLMLSPLSSGAMRYMYVNVVDSEFHQLVRTWLVCATCQQPTISKAFEIQLQVGGGKGSNKRVSFKNPYPSRKIFHLKSNRPDLLQFKENAFEIGPGESHNIGLRFNPQQTQFVAQVLIFINDAEDKNEETFCVNAVYR